MPIIFSTGYENETIEEFINKLSFNNIESVIDIREIPLSRKFGFSKNILKDKLNDKGIGYYHFSSLGSPTEIRHELRNGDLDYLDFFKKYRKHVRRQDKDIDETLDIITRSKKISLLCFEKEPELCHRTILISELLKMNHRMKIIPL